MGLSRLATFALSLLVALALSATAADARQRGARARQGAPKSGHAERTVTRTGADGTSRTSQHDTSWQRGDGMWSRDTVHTGPGGKQATTHVDGAKTDDGHVRDVTRTGPDGKTSTTHDEVHKTDGGYTRETTHTGPNGGVTTVQGQGTWDPATKTWTREKVVTRPNGSTSTTDVTRKVTPVTPETAPAE
jgi:hypothetical protein